ncbi:MAG: 50S ribosomal protein L24e [Candidatus Aenigmarchaeota archaeon]|nr:50S ribosomal protein L24e [Candidatus Aenigmarchaeota archaeon]
MKCSVCNETIPEGKGKMFVKNNGRIFYFDKSKCENNFKMGREIKKLKWARVKETVEKPAPKTKK